MEGEGEGGIKGGAIADCRACRCPFDGEAEETGTDADVTSSLKGIRGLNL